MTGLLLLLRDSVVVGKGGGKNSSTGIPRAGMREVKNSEERKKKRIGNRSKQYQAIIRTTTYVVVQTGMETREESQHEELGPCQGGINANEP